MKSVFAATCLLLLLAGFALGAPTGLHSLLIDPGVVASGMGHAYTAVADDPSALYWNPAGLTRGALGYDLLLSHTEWFVDHRMEYAAVTRNRGGDAFGASISGFYVGGIERREDFPTSEPFGDFGSYDLVVSVAYARVFGPARAGLTAKPFYSKIDRESAHGVAFDLGAQLDTPLEGLVLGGAVANIGNKPSYIEEEFSLPVDLRGGAAYRFSFDSGALPGEVLLSGEVRKSRDEETRTHVGADLRVKETASIRFGYKWGYELEDYSFGIGVTRGNFSAQYALVPFQSDFGTVHRFGIVLHRDKI
ncbi:MAG: PorV/PorQ family protein [Candidatus Eisenbacteria bacterium]